MLFAFCFVIKDLVVTHRLVGFVVHLAATARQKCGQHLIRQTYAIDAIWHAWEAKQTNPYSCFFIVLYRKAQLLREISSHMHSIFLTILSLLSRDDMFAMIRIISKHEPSCRI